MHESTQAENFGSDYQASSLGGLVHVEKQVGLSIEKEVIDLPETYQPSDGSFGEFVSDVKKILNRTKDDFREKMLNSRESWNRILHRRTSQGI